jgi:hypothetical protein
MSSVCTSTWSVRMVLGNVNLYVRSEQCTVVFKKNKDSKTKINSADIPFVIQGSIIRTARTFVLPKGFAKCKMDVGILGAELVCNLQHLRRLLSITL